MIKNEIQLKQDLQAVQNELQKNADYEEKEYASDVIRAYTRWYENNPPTENLHFPFHFRADLVGDDAYLTRLMQAFTAAGKVFTYDFV